MYRLASPDKITIIPHFCHTLELAEIVKNYIESRHDCTIITEERPGKMYYDCPGAKILNDELYNVELPFIDVRIDDVSILAASIEYLEHDCVKGFSRIASFANNICLSEAELKECKEFVLVNKDLIRNWDNEADFIIRNRCISGFRSPEFKLIPEN